MLSIVYGRSREGSLAIGIGGSQLWKTVESPGEFYSHVHLSDLTNEESDRMNELELKFLKDMAQSLNPSGKIKVSYKNIYRIESDDTTEAATGRNLAEALDDFEYTLKHYHRK